MLCSIPPGRHLDPQAHLDILQANLSREQNCIILKVIERISCDFGRYRLLPFMLHHDSPRALAWLYQPQPALVLHY